MSGIKEYDLKIGETAPIKKGFMTTISIVYAGMPGPDVFSLAVTTSYGQVGTAYNIYIPRQQSRVDIAGGYLEILRLQPESILLRFTKN